VEVYSHRWNIDKIGTGLSLEIADFLQKELEVVSLIPLLKFPIGDALCLVTKVDDHMFLAVAHHIDNPKHENIAQFINSFIV
jgi:hypothetical protein